MQLQKLLCWLVGLSVAVFLSQSPFSKFSNMMVAFAAPLDLPNSW